MDKHNKYDLISLIINGEKLDARTVIGVYPPEEDRGYWIVDLRDGNRMTFTGLVTCIFKNNPTEIREKGDYDA